MTGTPEREAPRPINDYSALKTFIKSDADALLIRYLYDKLIDVKGVGGVEKMFEAVIEGLLDAAADMASQRDLDTDKVTEIFNRKMQERGVKPTEIKGK